MSWKKTSILGKGSFGTVYLAESVDSTSEKYVVVKSTKLANARTSSLMKEVGILRMLRGNPFVVRCYGFDKSIERGEEIFNILIEYAPGGTLADFMFRDCNKLGMPENTVGYFSYMLLRGLFYIHRRNLVHCDIKPSNVLVFDTRNKLNYLKLSDFGLSKYASEEETGGFCGTRLYGAPEALAGGFQGKAADIFSFGCTVLEMMLGSGGITREGTAPPFVPTFLSERTRDFLSKCFCSDPSKRWTAEMLLDHAFIRKYRRMFAAPGYERSTLIQMKNPFGSVWIEEKNMFSERRSCAALPWPPSPALVAEKESEDHKKPSATASTAYRDVDYKDTDEILSLIGWSLCRSLF